MLEERLRHKLAKAQNALVIAVGGGNDSVTSLFLQRQLEEDFEFKPKRIVIAAMLPDGVEYKDLGLNYYPQLYDILGISTRWIGKKKIEAFPEPLLADTSRSLGIERVVGLDMIKGSNGVARALHYLIASEKFDTVLAVDAGGDFVVVPENPHVMSPMMDSYALFALKAAVASNPGTNFVFALVGMGTDGESTPEMLDLALNRLGEVYQGSFKLSPRVGETLNYYDSVISPNRESRTAALIIQSIKGFPIHRFEYQFRNRFHTQPTLGDIRTHYTYFNQVMDEEHTGKYYLFDRVWSVRNPYAISTDSSSEWFKGIQAMSDKMCHELNGQSCNVEGHGRVLFGTPPLRFEGEQRRTIIQEIIESIYNGVHPVVYMYSDDIKDIELSGLSKLQEGKLTLVTQGINSI